MTSYIERCLNEEEVEQESAFTRKLVAYRNKFYHFINLRSTKGVIFLFIFSISVPTLIYFFVIHKGITDVKDMSTCLVERTYRVPCGKVNITNTECSNVYCCYDTISKECYHFLPSKYSYKLKSDYYVPSNIYTPFRRESTSKMSLSIRNSDVNHVAIVLGKYKSDARNPTQSTTTLATTVDEDKLEVEIIRNNTNEHLLTTSLGPLIVSEHYWEWTLMLTTERLWGLGEVEIKKNTTTTKVIYKNEEDHNTLPKFMAYVNGSYHGVEIEHEGPLEVTILPSYLIILKSLAGNSIAIHVTAGPTPADVVMQQHMNKSVFRPPYWALGPHICREGNATLASIIEEYKNWKANPKNDIDYSSECLHEDLYLLLHYASETERNEIIELVAEHQKISKFLMSMPPQIPVGDFPIYNLSVNLKQLYENQMGGLLNGMYHGKQVVYPAYFPPATHEWFKTLIKIVPAQRFDGFVLTSNWPSLENYIFVDNETFPYLTDNLKKALSNTVPFNASSIYGTHLLRHNQYGSDQANMFNEFLPKNDTILISASHHYYNSYSALIQNFNVSWSDLKRALHTTLYHSLFGTNLISIPVCGDTKHFDPNKHEKICMRWYIMAATMPLFRISSDLPRRDPTNLISGQAYAVAKDAILKRQLLLPYFYTVLFMQQPLTRPMFYDFYFDNETFVFNEQYMVGDAILMAQPVLPDSAVMSIYLPPSAGVWYEFWGGLKYTKLGKLLLNIVETDWIAFIAGGKIVPMRNRDGNSSNPDSLTLVVALNCPDITLCHSEGKLYNKYDYVTFLANSTGVTVGHLNDNTRKDLGCKENTSTFPSVIRTVKLYGSTDFGEIFTKNVNLCGKIEGEELYFTYK